MAHRPELVVVAGPNGVGKTTLAREYAFDKGIPYIGADAIAETISPTEPAIARIEAGRRFLLSVDDHLSQEESLVVETTLSGRTFGSTIVKSKELGYDVSIAFLFLESADTCIARVTERVRKGGHYVPDEDVRRRFSRSIVNFWTVYRRMADSWVLLYNGTGQLQDVAGGSGDDVSVRDTTLFEVFMKLVGTPSHD